MVDERLSNIEFSVTGKVERSRIGVKGQEKCQSDFRGCDVRAQFMSFYKQTELTLYH